MLARPADEKFILPGSARASAMNSGRFLAGRFGGTISACGTLATGVTPVKSFAGSNGRLLFTTAPMVWPFEVSISV